jgi:hypothetical protein
MSRKKNEDVSLNQQVTNLRQQLLAAEKEADRLREQLAQMKDQKLDQDLRRIEAEYGSVAVDEHGTPIEKDERYGNARFLSAEVRQLKHKLFVAEEEKKVAQRQRDDLKRQLDDRGNDELHYSIANPDIEVLKAKIAEAREEFTDRSLAETEVLMLDAKVLDDMIAVLGLVVSAPHSYVEPEKIAAQARKVLGDYQRAADEASEEES